ncbi:MAG: neutral zinc metallopeptidase [Pirellulales bacterium]
MRWQGGRESSNIEDRRSRGRGPGSGVMVGGIGTLAVAFAAIMMGANPQQVVNTLLKRGDGPVAAQQGGGAPTAADEELDKFIRVVLADTEDTWTELFRRMGKKYEPPILVLFDGHTESACGNASAAMGPFYCPADQKLYLDVSFFRELKEKYSAPGDFAQAYVIAHEVAHHVQHQLGVSDEVQQLRRKANKVESNRLSVQLELQADFLAGVWAYHANQTRQIIESGDVDEALDAANAIGDDALQRRARGYVVPDSFTHGTSEQRKRWFRKGLETGDLEQGNTFIAKEL